MAKHTHWTISAPAPDRELAFAYSIRRPDGWAVAEVCHWPNDAGQTARLIAAAPAMRETLEATDIALTNILQTAGEKTLGGIARPKLALTRDRIRALLATIDQPIADALPARAGEPDPRHATRDDADTPGEFDGGDL